MCIRDRYGAPNIEQFAEAAETRSGWLADVERWVSDRSVLIRRRSTIRSLSAVAGSAREDLADRRSDADQSLAPDGERIGESVELPPRLEAIQRARLAGFEIDQDDVEVVRATVRALQERGVQVVLVEMPVPRRFVDLHPGGQESVRQVRATIESLAAELNVTAIVGVGGFEEDDFLDFTHLDAAGSRWFSDVVADQLTLD